MGRAASAAPDAAKRPNRPYITITADTRADAPVELVRKLSS